MYQIGIYTFPSFQRFPMNEKNLQTKTFKLTETSLAFIHSLTHVVKGK